MEIEESEFLDEEEGIATQDLTSSKDSESENIITQ